MRESFYFIDNIKYVLKEEHDFSWLKKYGKVFKVFDQNDSGNISFGVDDGKRKLFIKFAGANTVNYQGKISDAVNRSINTAIIHQDIKHPNLINLIDSFEISSGYALVYEWRDGECLHAHWDFDKYPKYTHPSSPSYKFRMLPLEKKLDCLDIIFDFLKTVASFNYVAIDFYDGSIMYDFNKDITTICDIELYSKKPYINKVGRMWGSSRFMSPEEYLIGSMIDEVTNVYTAGATAFELLGNSREHSFENWKASKALYDVARIATNDDRTKRYQSLAEFIKAWKQNL